MHTIEVRCTDARKRSAFFMIPLPSVGVAVRILTLSMCPDWSVRNVFQFCLGWCLLDRPKLACYICDPPRRNRNAARDSKESPSDLSSLRECIRLKVEQERAKRVPALCCVVPGTHFAAWIATVASCACTFRISRIASRPGVVKIVPYAVERRWA